MSGPGRGGARGAGGDRAAGGRGVGERSGSDRLVALVALLAAAALVGVAGGGAPAAAQPARRDRHLGPARDVQLLVFPLESFLSASAWQPIFAVEVRVHVGAGVALAARPMGVWYAAGTVGEGHGGGVGGALALLWYLDRALAGPYVGVQGGDVEAFVDGERGRTFGGSALFGYARTWRSGALVDVALGLGYWHRTGVLDTGQTWPEVLSLRVGLGWGW